MGASGMLNSRLMLVPIGAVAVTAPGGAGLIWIVLSVVSATGALIAKLTGPARRTPVSPSLNELGVTVSGSMPNVNAEVSPGVQPAAISPLAGAHTAMPCLSTTSEENTRL